MAHHKIQEQSRVGQSAWVGVPLFTWVAIFRFEAVFDTVLADGRSVFTGSLHVPGRAFWVGTRPAFFAGRRDTPLAGRCEISFCFRFVSLDPGFITSVWSDCT